MIEDKVSEAAAAIVINNIQAIPINVLRGSSESEMKTISCHQSRPKVAESDSYEGN